MNNVKCLTRILVPIAMLCGAAASAADSGLYLGLSLGEAKFDIAELPSNFTPPIPVSAYLKDSSSATSVFIGYRFSPYFGAELSYMDLGTLKYSATGRSTAPAVSAAYNFEGSASGIGLVATGAMPIGNFDIHVKAGGLQTKTEASEVVRSNSLGQAGASDSASTFEMMYGLGVGYTIGEHCNFAIDWTNIPDVGDEDVTGEADVSVLAFTFAYRF